jgi:hypothetical protein
MARASRADLLAPLPARIRDRLLAPDVVFEPGGAAVLGRFFAALTAARERMDAPSRASFEAATASESTLATLLRTLARHVPEVSTAAGRQLRKEWYVRRPGRTKVRRRGRAGLPQVAPAHWPEEWRQHYPALLEAPVRSSTVRRHVESLDRLARLLPGLQVSPELTFILTYGLSKALREEGVGEITIANYLGVLVALGKAGGAEDAGLDGIRLLRMYAKEQAELAPKKKEARIEALNDRGGYGHILERLLAVFEAADAAPAHSALAEQHRQSAAVLALAINMPPRTGDMSRWVLGKDIIRHPSGAWRLAWRQEKTEWRADAGELWPETCLILDRLILAGYPDRLVHLRYEMLAGCNWLTLTPEAPGRSLPSERVRAAIGIPLHDFRTLAGDILRDIDPAAARNLIAGLLGHKTTAAGDDYRAQSTGEAAALEWQDIRQRLMR